MHKFFTFALDFYWSLFFYFVNLLFILSNLFLGSAIGFRLDSLLKLTETRARDKKLTLMHYLCKVHVAIYSLLFSILCFAKCLNFLRCYKVTCNVNLGKDCSFFHLLILRWSWFSIGASWQTAGSLRLLQRSFWPRASSKGSTNSGLNNFSEIFLFSILIGILLTVA